MIFSAAFPPSGSDMKLMYVLIVSHNLHAMGITDRYWKQKLEEVGTKNLGVAVTIEKLETHKFSGKVEIDNLVIANPHGYSTPNMFRAGRVIVNIGMRQFLRSMGSTLYVQDLEVKCLDVFYHKKLRSSNFNDVLTHIGQQRGGQAHSRSLQGAQPETGTQVYLKKVNLTGIEAKTKILVAPTANLALPNIVKPDFSKEMGHTGTTEVISFFMQMLFHSVTTSLTHALPFKHGQKSCFEKLAAERKPSSSSSWLPSVFGHWETFAVAWEGHLNGMTMPTFLLAIILGLVGGAFAWHRRQEPAAREVVSRMSRDTEEIDRLNLEIVE